MNYSIRKAEIKEIEIELTGTCQLECPLCTRNTEASNHRSITNIRRFKELVETFEEYPSLELLYIAGTSTEPTLHPDFIELCEYWVSRGIRLELHTNGNGRKLTWWKKLSKILTPQDKVFFCICGSTQEVHEYYRKGSDLAEIMANAKAFRTYKANDVFQFIRFEYNIHELEMDSLKEMISEYSDLLIVDTEIDRSPKHYIEEVPKGIAPYPDRRVKLKAIIEARVTKGVMSPLCFKQKSIFIDQFGKAYGCYSFPKEQPEDYFKGDPYNFEDQFNCTHEVCWKCTSRSVKLVDVFNLEYIY